MNSYRSSPRRLGLRRKGTSKITYSDRTIRLRHQLGRKREHLVPPQCLSDLGTYRHRDRDVPTLRHND